MTDPGTLTGPPHSRRSCCDECHELRVVPDVVGRVIRVACQDEQDRVSRALVLDPPGHRGKMQPDRRRIQQELLPDLAIVSHHRQSALGGNQQLLAASVGMRTPRLGGRYVVDQEESGRLEGDVGSHLSRGEATPDVNDRPELMEGHPAHQSAPHLAAGGLDERSRHCWGHCPHSRRCALDCLRRSRGEGPTASRPSRD